MCCLFSCSRFMTLLEMCCLGVGYRAQVVGCCDKFFSLRCLWHPQQSGVPECCGRGAQETLLGCRWKRRQSLAIGLDVVLDVGAVTNPGSWERCVPETAVNSS